jgi:hypothetical protein
MARIQALEVRGEKLDPAHAGAACRYSSGFATTLILTLGPPLLPS